MSVLKDHVDVYDDAPRHMIARLLIVACDGDFEKALQTFREACAPEWPEEVHRYGQSSYATARDPFGDYWAFACQEVTPLHRRCATTTRKGPYNFRGDADDAALDMIDMELGTYFVPTP